jgi:hypothetical protein
MWFEQTVIHIINYYKVLCVACKFCATHLSYLADINECLSGPCQNSAACTDNVNGYTCTCVDGYTGVHCETGGSEWIHMGTMCYFINISMTFITFLLENFTTSGIEKINKFGSGKLSDIPERRLKYLLWLYYMAQYKFIIQELHLTIYHRQFAL